MSKLLLVEDEQKTGSYLEKGLSESGFVVDWTQSGADGMSLASNASYDLIILDVMLPEVDGWTILKTLRQNRKMTPVLFLTAMDDVKSRVKGLELGADDYLVKPFAFSELLARIRSLLRRTKAPVDEICSVVADLELDLDARKATRNGIPIELSGKEFALLELLVAHQGEVLSRALIASQIWGINFDSQTNVIDVAIKRLRQKVDDPYETKLIRTVRGMGYIIEKNNN